MLKRSLVFLGLVAALAVLAGTWTLAQEENGARIRVTVDVVQLNVAVTDSKGNYITDLRPEDFVVTEDGIPEEIATFGAGDEPARRLPNVSVPDAQPPPVPVAEQKSNSAQPVSASASGSPAPGDERAGTSPGTPVDVTPQGNVSSTAVGIHQNGLTQAVPAAALAGGANVFVLFDTSNYMYRGFVFAQDSIADFVGSLENADRVAFYSYSRDLSRGALLTSDRSAVLRGVRTSVAGDDAALYNSLLLTVQDAARIEGRKVIVVFSNGPDNASMVPPEQVAELAQSTGTTIYMVTTKQAQLEPISNAVFRRLTAATGGKVYFAENWKEEQESFASIREDLAHLYSLSYYPKANANRGWRTITVRLVSGRHKGYHIRTRDGYRIQPSRFTPESASSALPEQGPQ